MTKAFPDDFIWGTATASYQIEGASTEGGRGATIWDTFSDTPGKITDGSSGDVACDHYHRWQDDIKLMQALNIKAYRFSIAWSRIFPTGRGEVNQTGIDFYSRLVDGLLDAGITPYVTLYHWDLPQSLQNEGGWTRRGITDDFVNYADTVSRALGDRVKHWITFNEPWVFAWVGHVFGEHAPGWKGDSPAPALSVTHHALLSHGLVVPVLRANSANAQVGITLNLTPAYPASDSPQDIAAAKRHDGWFNRWYLDPVYKGSYPQDMVEAFGDAMPTIETGDMEIIHAPINFLGVNYYMRALVKASDKNPLGFEQVRPEGDYTAMDWEIYPEGLYTLLKRLDQDYAPGAIYITENGAAFDDELTPDGKVEDPRRVAYLQGHFDAAARAVAEGVPLKGYFVWSLMDNFEWGFGFSKRFGLYYVDYATQQRYLKNSGAYLAEVAGEYN